MNIRKTLRDYLMAGLAALVLVTPIAAQAAMEIRNDYGGNIVTYMDKYSDLKATEGRLRLDGFCLSACTLFLGLVPRRDQCATPGSVLGFHSASTLNGEYAAEGTRLIWNLYPENVREALRTKGWDGETQPHPEFIYFPATQFMEVCASAKE